LRALVHPARKPVEGVVEAPPSKSYTHRALFAALLASGESVVENQLIAGTTKRTLAAVAKFGARVSGSVVRGAFPPKSPAAVYCGSSGTTLRLATAVAALAEGPVTLYGSPSLNRRPIGPLLKALESLGARTLSRSGYPPVSVKGGLGALRQEAEISIDGSASSQFVSALLLISPVLGLRIRVSALKSAPYVDMTLRVAEAFGVKFYRDGYSFFEPASGAYRPSRFRVPGDFSSTSFVLALGALAGRVRVTGLDANDVQADRAVLGILASMGASVRTGEGYVEVEAPGQLEGVEVDCSNTPDLVPVVAVLAAHARGTTIISGVEHLAYKESNRLLTITKNLRRLGVDARVEGGSSIVVRGGTVRGGRVSSYGDHRIAMAFAVAAARAEGPVEISGFEKYRESYPSFLEHLRALGLEVEVL